MTYSKLMHDAMSPYEDLDPKVQEYLKKLCEGAHGKFISYVKQQRGNKVKDDPSTFSGDIFTGQEAKERGLIDEVGSMVDILEQRHPGAKLDIEPEQRSILNRVLSL